MPWRMLFLCLAVWLSGCVPGLCQGTGRKLYFSLIDQLPPQAGAATAVDSLEERRRLPVFNAALQEVVRAGKLPPSELINREVDLRAGTRSEKPQSAGTPVVRIFLTRWTQTTLGGAANSEIQCRFFAEEVRDGKTVLKLGPFFARVPSDESLAPTGRERKAAYQAAARAALMQLTESALNVSPVRALLAAPHRPVDYSPPIP